MGNGRIHKSSAYWEMGLEALDFKNYIAVNYTLIRKYGLHAAVLIGELASEARYYKREGKLDDGWFFSTVENIEEHTGLNAYYQRETLKALQDMDIIEIKYSGLPRKRYFRVDVMRVIEEMSADDKPAGQQQSFTQSTTSDSSSEPLAVRPVDDNNCKEQPKQIIKKKERKKPAETYDSIIDGFTQDQELRDALRGFLQYRVASAHRSKKEFTNQALRLNLTKLRKLSSDPQTMTAIVNQTVEKGWSGFFELKDGTPRKSQRQIDFSEYEQPKLGSKRYNSTTDITEVYKGNGVWEIQQPTLFEGERYEDIPYDL